MAKHRLDDGDGQQWGGPDLTAATDGLPNRHVADDPEATTPLPVVGVTPWSRARVTRSSVE
jgi:hypothetical protein